MPDQPPKRLRSEIWFNDTAEPGETAIYIERFSTYGLGRQELQSGRPVIGIAQTGGDLTPCNRIHVTLAERVRDGIRDAGGIAFEFPDPVAVVLLDRQKPVTRSLERLLDRFA